MSTIGIDCRFEPEKPLEYTPAKLDKLINAALKAKPAYKTTYAWEWPLQNIEFDLDFDGSVKSLPMDGLLINDIVHATYISTLGDWKRTVAKFLCGEVKRSQSFTKELRVHKHLNKYLDEEDLPKGLTKAIVTKAKATSVDILVKGAVSQPPTVQMTLGLSGLKPSDWAKEMIMRLNPGWKLIPTDHKKTDMYFEIREGETVVGKWGTSAEVCFNLSSYSMERIVEIIDLWMKSEEALNLHPLACEVWMYNHEREKDQAAEYAIGLSQAPDGQATWIRVQYAVMSHEGLASLKQWPARSDGKELESSVCYFERNRRERAAISVATGPKGQYIFFTSVQSTMQAELEKLFGLKLKRVKVAKR